ncbi:hypothetical protein AB6Q56_14470 [Dechloromonas sp. ARDL1]|uniref:hypothetical protein n=1 Tax=Dechloromonas sp. ARDL1 TaxID=3322121 RepID=UPI003DA705E3
MIHGEALVFRSSSFSRGSFNVKSWRFDGHIEKPKDNGWLGGGSGIFDHFQSAEDKRLERERLGIIPAEVKRLVEVVARIEARDVSEPYQAEQRAIEALAHELEQENIAWHEAYADAVREAFRQIVDAELRDMLRRWNEQQDEEQAILLMLSEM